MKRRTGGVGTAPCSPGPHGLKAASPAQQAERDKCAETLPEAAGGACAGAEEEQEEAAGPACGETLPVVPMSNDTTTPVAAGAGA